ncbi:MAG: hypothetical protein H0X37_06105 [Herpetosiphonaceae bacterium]|nr:hypothetical protein [Herpetosiphonaceae bacterium]
MTETKPLGWHTLRTGLILAGALTIILSLVRWGGTAKSGPILWAGVGLLSGLIIGFGILTWWLYLSPLHTTAVTVSQRSPQLRQMVGLLVLMSGTLFALGGFWDEVWHRRFGGFGNDFLWPPHMLLYGSIALTAAFALGGIVLIVRGTGGLRERFRSEPLLGLLGLITCYLLASVPSDELWHRIYGKDLTAWSLPHLLLAGGFALVMLVGVSLQLSLIPLRPWQGLRGLRGGELLALVMVAWATIGLLQIGATEWDTIHVLGETRDAFENAFWHRPLWLYPAVITTVSIFCGTFTLHALRRAGTATLLGLLVLGLRLLLLVSLGGFAPGVSMSYTSHLLVLPPLVALDIWYATRLSRGSTLSTLISGNLVAGLVFVACDLPLIGALMVYPPVNRSTLPGMLGMSLAMALVAGWAGARFGSWIGTLDRPAGTTAPITRRARWTVLGVATVAAALVLMLILTAHPPA